MRDAIAALREAPRRDWGSSRVQIDVAPVFEGHRGLAEDVRDGLSRAPKELPSKYLYDARGSRLFDLICDLPEYYPTRTERAILVEYADEIAAATGAVELLELGSGSAVKTRLLLSALESAGTLETYLPVDVSESALRQSAARLVPDYPELRVHGLVGDFDRDLARLPEPRGPRLVAFLGGTIGNFTPAARRSFLSHLARTLGAEAQLLIGIDLVKDRAALEAAYDDSAGVTAEFNLNVLRVINSELGANFELDAFEHVALYDEENAWIEMRLRARSAQSVAIPGAGLEGQFLPGEEIRTEISAKFTRERIGADLEAAGLELVDWYTDPRELFALTLSRAARDK